MNETIFEKIEQCACTLNIELSAQEMAHYASTVRLLDSDLTMIHDIFGYLRDKKVETVVNMLLRTSKLPLKEPKSFENFDFCQQTIGIIIILPNEGVNLSRGFILVGVVPDTRRIIHSGCYKLLC